MRRSSFASNQVPCSLHVSTHATSAARTREVVCPQTGHATAGAVEPEGTTTRACAAARSDSATTPFARSCVTARAAALLAQTPPHTPQPATAIPSAVPTCRGTLQRGQGGVGAAGGATATTSLLHDHANRRCLPRPRGARRVALRAAHGDVGRLRRERSSALRTLQGDTLHGEASSRMRRPVKHRVHGGPRARLAPTQRTARAPSREWRGRADPPARPSPKSLSKDRHV
jgi:hypothetical protein